MSKLYSTEATLYNPRRVKREPGETRKHFEARKDLQAGAVGLVEYERFRKLVNFTAWFWRFMGLDPKEWLPNEN